MNLSAITYIVLTTFVLITVVVFAAIGFPFNLVFYLIVFGQALLVFSVFKVLTDPYTTNKTFKDFYEDYPIGMEE